MSPNLFLLEKLKNSTVILLNKLLKNCDTMEEVKVARKTI